MRKDYSIFKDRRKELVKALGEGMGVKPKYLGVPSCAYGIGAVTITKDCCLESEDEEALQKASAVLETAGFKAAEEAPAERADHMTVSIPREKLSDGDIEKLRKIVDSKRTLLTKSLGADSLEITVDDEKVSFPWFPLPKEEGEAEAYTVLIEKLCKMAKEQKRITAKDREPVNPRYECRCFLLRLNMIGKEYKTTRKILLRNLEGSSAFRTGNGKEQA